MAHREQTSGETPRERAARTASSLEDLLAALCAPIDRRDGNGDEVDLVEWTNLPTFGGEEPRSTSGIWSWDPTRLLVGTCADDLRIVERPICTASGSGWYCARPAKARQLCTGHLSQQARGQPLTPLRSRQGGLVPCPIRVSRRVAERASEDPDGARGTLDRWADRPKKVVPQR